MLRTINAAVRGELVIGQVQKVIRANSTARTSRILSSSSGGASSSVACRRHVCSTNNGIQVLPSCITAPLRSTLGHQQRRLYSSDLPPHTKVNLPALSPTMEEGTLISWEKKEGDKLSEGDLLAEIETDKATMAMETPEEGYLAKILIPAGTKGVPIGKLVCIIVEKEEDVAKFKDFVPGTVDTVAKPKAAAPSQAHAPQAPAAVYMPPPVLQQQQQQQQQPQASEGGRVYASPMARRLAEQKNIRLQGKGTGLYGSITSKDLDNMLKGAPGPIGVPAPSARPSMTPQAAPSAFVDHPVSNMRAIIAKRLMQSKQQVPHYYLTNEVVMDRIIDLRKRANERIGEKDKHKFISINDFVLKAVAAACQRVPEVNSAWMDSVIRQYNSVDISVAVSTDKGLITPIIFNAQALGVHAISEQMKALAAKARAGKLQPHEFQGGTISVSNLGMYGVTEFAAIINPPQAAILAVGASTKRDDRSVMNVTLSADHRVVDGAVGAQWLKVLRECLEDPESMIL